MKKLEKNYGTTFFFGINKAENFQKNHKIKKKYK